ncbi:LysM peptidoglycan-binding domain-containing protein [Luteolibacter pohnpeiensis]|uniref:LysM peptidoglycan-binding domain-containing protein n=1 Tax=Luteolibacter pohnpeiensis TaxID=454153 RepID=A0A934SBR1_9BACT|nr:LysM peptidoglycan-binding domain-containing protein [Luteolibacter pohnpeiensis]MBK1883242.1 LysM peptidoglycan-binding domain-containing protein [Luteolibacter pohnpeiensis]
MKSPIWLAASAMLLTAPLGLSKTELETLRSLCNEQERQIHQLEEENAHLRLLAGEKAKPRLEENSRGPSDSTRSEPSSSGKGQSYTIRSGDTLAAIARKYGTTVNQLTKANGIKNAGLISVGQVIVIPQASPAPQNASAPAAPAPSHQAADQDDIYIIKPGETFYSIAKAHGMSTDTLMAANPGVKASQLRTGQKLHLGRATSSQQIAKAEKPAPAPAPQAPSSPAPAKEASRQEAKTSTAQSTGGQPAIRSITVNGEMTYGEVANKYGVDVGRLNDLNGLNFADATLLAKGSELYIPAQP